MKKINNRKIKSKYQNDGDIFINVPKSVYENTDLNTTDKLILSLITGYKKTWNDISTKTIAGYFHLERETINHSIRKLIFLELLEEKYTIGRKRSFRSLLPVETRNDIFSIITDSILLDKSLSNTYKLTFGVIVAASIGDNNDLGGFNFGSLTNHGIKALAKRLNLSVSSVYRHLAILAGEKYIEREYGQYLIKPQDPYVRNHTENVVKTKQHEESLKQASEPPGEILPEVNTLLDEIYDRV